ncbi:MAG: aldolase/citrate lyase family protein, partial [Burkholderiales bacterium]
MTIELKRKIAAGEPIVAVNVGGGNADMVEGLGRLGGDVAFIDCERTGIGLDVATQVIRAARVGGIPAVVRSWSRDPEVLVQYLDRKVDGLVVPHVESAAEAASIVELVRYACGKDADKKVVIVQIETTAAVKAVDELAAVQGIDV